MLTTEHATTTSYGLRRAFPARAGACDGVRTRTMRWSLGAAAALLFCASAAAAQDAALRDVDLTAQGGRLAYSLGYRSGERARRIAGNAEAFDAAAFLVGVQDALSERAPRLSAEELQAAVDDYAQRMEERRSRQASELAERNLEEGKAFLAANAGRENVSILADGLQFESLATGTGANAEPHSIVTMHVRGTLLDGTVFMDTYAGKHPRRVQVDRTLPAWSEALQKMAAGGKCRLVCPPVTAADVAESPVSLPEGRGRHLTVIFELEVLSIKDGDADTR